MVIRALAKRGLYLCDIAKQVGVHPRAVRRVLNRGDAPAMRPSRRGSRLDPHRADIDRLLAEDVWNAVVIFRKLHAKGYTAALHSAGLHPTEAHPACSSGDGAI